MFKKNQVLYFFYKAVLFAAIIILLDIVIGSILQTLYFRQKSGIFYRATYSIEQSDEQILVLGSSRANHHYHPGVLSNILKKSCYNAGRDGNSIFYHYSVLKMALQRKTPEIVILDFSNLEFRYAEENYSRISSLLPYYRRHPEIRDVIMLKSPFERYKVLSSIYPFNSMAFTILRRSLVHSVPGPEDKDGYIPLFRKYHHSVEVMEKETTYEADTNKVKYFEKLITIARDAGARMFVICSPRFLVYKYKDHSLVLGKKIAEAHGVPFFDYSADPYFTTRPDFFADVSHLNDDGAREFSKKVAGAIQNYEKHQAGR